MTAARKKEPAWVAAFLAALGSCGNVTRSAALAGIDTTGPYNRRNRDAGFRAAWDQAIAAREERAAGSVEAGSSVAPPDKREPAAEVELSASKAGFRRVAASRWSKASEELFLTELTTNANVQRAATAAGFSAAAVYKRRGNDPHFAAGWDAAIAVGRVRLESFLIVQAERNFDPDALPIGEGDPKVSVSEALNILKHKPPVAVVAAAAPGWDDDEAGADPMAEVRARIIDKLDQVRTIEEARRTAEGWTRYGDDWVPPGWVKA